MLLVQKYPPICKKSGVSSSISFQAEMPGKVQLLWRTIILSVFPKVLESSSSFACLLSEFGAPSSDVIFVTIILLNGSLKFFLTCVYTWNMLQDSLEFVSWNQRNGMFMGTGEISLNLQHISSCLL